MAQTKQRSKATTAKLPVPTFDQVVRFAPKLSEWTDMAATAFGLYQGVNRAIRDAEDKGTDSAMMADQLRQQLALMAVIRCFAVLDRSTEISFQSVHRLFKTGCILQHCTSEEIERFCSTYAELDFKAVGRLQSFRNHALAHITWNDAKSLMTYGQLEALIRTSCALADQLNLIASGLNNDPMEHLGQAEEDSFQFWSAVLRDNPDPFMMAGNETD